MKAIYSRIKRKDIRFLAIFFGGFFFQKCFKRLFEDDFFKHI